MSILMGIRGRTVGLRDGDNEGGGNIVDVHGGERVGICRPTVSETQPVFGGRVRSTFLWGEGYPRKATSFSQRTCEHRFASPAGKGRGV